MEMIENNNNGENLNNRCNNMNNNNNNNNDNSRFPEGMKVLAVDDNLVCLKLLTTLLNKCKYQVTSLANKSEALEVLRQNVENFDIVLTDVYVDDIEGFKLVEVGIELNIPVIMISASASNDIIMKGVRFGLVNYLIKPVRLEVLQTIWQHVYKKKFICSSTSPLIDRPVSPSNDRVEVCRGDNGTSEDDRKEDENVVTDGNDKEINYKEIQDSVETSKSSSKGEKRKSPIRGDEDNVESGNNPTEKKGRIKWIKERNDKFLLVVQTLGGIEKAVPKKILELMEDPDLTREQVASHLQKIRDNHKKKANLDQNTSHTSTNNSNINNNDNNNINDNNYYFNSPRLPAPSSMRPLVGTTPTHRPPLPNTMPPWGLLGPNYQIRPNNNHCWMGPPIGYRPQLLQQPQQQQPRMMMPSISNNYFETNPTPTMFQHIPQGSSFDSRLQQPPEEVFDHGPAMIDTTFDLSFSNIFDDIAPEYPSFDFPDDNKDQIHRL